MTMGSKLLRNWKNKTAVVELPIHGSKGKLSGKDRHHKALKFALVFGKCREVVLLFLTLFTVAPFVFLATQPSNVIVSLGAEPYFDAPELTESIDFCNGDARQTYVVCNGLSNQLLGHAGFISSLIQSKTSVTIPDAFIFNGVQGESNGGGVLKNVVANKNNSIPLTSIINGNALLRVIRRHGVNACFIPHDKVISSEKQTMECAWLQRLKDADNDVELDVLDAMKPSILLSDIVETTFSNLQDKISNFALSDGVCLHHRDGPDWHNHCTLWKGNNCMNVENRAIEDLVKDRIPAAYTKKWMYYIGDEVPSEMLSDAIENRANLDLFHRVKDKLLENDDVQKLLGDVKLSLEKHRDIFAAVDFFVCSHIPSFIGNSVSTFSALQIGKRRGKNSTWYNSRSNPLLADFMQVQEIPVVYTYTESSKILGKILLKASIISVRRTFGMDVDINIIYHGTEDNVFLEWLAQWNVIIHKHDPKWLPMIDAFISNANKQRSHLYSHRGNYIGTWQRIDIPLFIDAEYVLFLDCDTIVHAKFDLSTFGLDITPGIAFSNEIFEDDIRPSNAGVALFNVPKLRETYEDFLAFIQDHADKNVDFVLGPSDQGAYLDFYHAHKKPGVALDHEASEYVQHLDTTFNVKPYYTSKKNFEKRKIVHYHGLKPHQVLQALLGYKEDNFEPSVQFLVPMMVNHKDHRLLCLTVRDFSVSMLADEDNLNHFCRFAFPDIAEEKNTCTHLFQKLSMKQEGEDCMDVFSNFTLS
eukprot:CAMPEP_0195508860 /NCGR_PEP_ID=MMETSP0794_2-20130614/1961_1 /TAXON_ID=515487 /ORGANISM="Stephanopyxis turris, Strain CCMP 815" /LENGTH=754 /DNA_ID=CAMNT_0040635941 /DNA_START=35 /DNA_END=2299 /DNA_ORIENTATION=+